MNSAGFYAANVYDIVSAITEWYDNSDKWEKLIYTTDSGIRFLGNRLFFPPGIH